MKKTRNASFYRGLLQAGISSEEQVRSRISQSIFVRKPKDKKKLSFLSEAGIQKETKKEPSDPLTAREETYFFFIVATIAATKFRKASTPIARIGSSVYRNTQTLTINALKKVSIFFLPKQVLSDRELAISMGKTNTSVG